MSGLLTICLVISTLSDGMALSPTVKRRDFFRVATVSASTMVVASPALALDMDAFINKELQQDTPTEVTDDQRTCRYAAPGKDKGEACKRAGMSTSGKGNGVDAYGNIDRGDYVRCKTSYPMIDGQYVKTVTCT